MGSRSPRVLPRGLAYMVAHGHAADGSHADNTEPTQHLVNPVAHMPTRLDVVDSWVRLRAQQGDPLTSSVQPARPPAVHPEQTPRGRSQAGGSDERGPEADGPAGNGAEHGAGDNGSAGHSDEGNHS